ACPGGSKRIHRRKEVVEVKLAASILALAVVVVHKANFSAELQGVRTLDPSEARRESHNRIALDDYAASSTNCRDICDHRIRERAIDHLIVETGGQTEGCQIRPKAGWY